MNRFFKSIALFFTLVDYPALWKSCKEVLFLTFIALLPLLINITIASLAANQIIEPLKTKIIPGEMLSYCLSFIAPSLYLLTKTHGSGYKLPLLHVFSIVTLLLYVLTIVLYLVAKNNWVAEINMENHGFDLYFKLTLIFLSTSIIFRIYSVYHGKNASNWSANRQRQQLDFNQRFSDSIR
ncbi:MAG: hypothetical protein Q8M29_11505 [Bacteroidota bacterium]|nr:hypothetical protein [Bacteroidota bacterium]